nr:MAG TPA: helix-turn-helix domain protein [Caudoviricetes sp.]
MTTKIEAARRAVGLTQEELSRKVGVTVSAIANYENSRRHPRADILKRIAQALNVSMENLI